MARREFNLRSDERCVRAVGRRSRHGRRQSRCRRLVSQLENERINLPIVACGIGNDSNAAVDAIKGGAKEYVPLPPDPELIAAVLEAVSQESNAIVHADPAMKQVLAFADKIAPAVASALITGQSGTGRSPWRDIHVEVSANNFVPSVCCHT